MPGNRKNTYDYIVVGAGAAGCAVAHRLSEDPGVKVLLLEAGGPDSSPLIHMPAGFTKLTGEKVNWGFSTVPQRHVNQREMQRYADTRIRLVRTWEDVLAALEQAHGPSTHVAVYPYVGIQHEPITLDTA